MNKLEVKDVEGNTVVFSNPEWKFGWGCTTSIVPSYSYGVRDGVAYNTKEQAKAEFFALLDEWWEQKQQDERKYAETIVSSIMGAK